MKNEGGMLLQEWHVVIKVRKVGAIGVYRSKAYFPLAANEKDAIKKAWDYMYAAGYEILHTERCRKTGGAMSKKEDE